MKFIDTNRWSGAWPLSPVSLNGSSNRRPKAIGYEIKEALVSPFEAVFQMDPMPGNRANFEAVKKQRKCRPLPIINPATPAWEDHLEEVTENNRVVAIRLLPGYHGYTLRSQAVKKLADRLKEKKLRLIITTRLVDERHEHHSLNIKPVPLKHLKHFIEHEPKLHPLIQGLGIHELKELAKAEGTFSADTSFAEWEDTLRVMKLSIPVSRILFGSLSPLQVDQAQFDKVRLSSLSQKQREAVAFDNAQSFFNLQA